MLVFRQNLNRPLTAEEVDSNFKFLNITEWTSVSYLKDEFVYHYDLTTGLNTLYVCLVDHDFSAYIDGFSVEGEIDGDTVTLWKAIAGGSTDSRQPLTGTWTFVTGSTITEGQIIGSLPAITFSVLDSANVDWSDYFHFLNTLNLGGLPFLFQLSNVGNSGDILLTSVTGSTLNSTGFTINGVIPDPLIFNGSFDYGKSFHASFIPNGTGSGSTTLPIVSSVDIINEVCNGDANGSITINGSGGSGFRRFSLDGNTWSTTGYTSAITYTYTGLTAGTYSSLYIDDQVLGHILLPPAVITEPDPLVFTYSKNDEVVSGVTHDGTITLYADGGTPGYTYSKNGGSTYQSSPIFTGLTVGTYTCRVRDSNNCLSTPVIINVTYVNRRLQLLTVSAANPLCPGGTGSINITTINGSGQFRYRYNGGSWVPSVGSVSTHMQAFSGAGIVANTYNLEAWDILTNDIVSGTTVVTNPAGISLTGAITGTSKNCGAGGNASVFIRVQNAVINTPGFTKPQVKFGSAGTWSDMVPTSIVGTYTYLQSYSSVGTYSGTLYYRDFCSTGTTAYNVTKYNSVAISTSLNATPKCPTTDSWVYNLILSGGSGTYDVRIGSGGTWLSKPSSTTINVAQSVSGSPSTETIYYRDATNITCSGTTTVNNSKVTVIAVSLSSSTNPGCSTGTGSFTVSATGGLIGGTNTYEYALVTTGGTGTYQSSPIFSGLSGGTYNVAVRRVGTTCTPSNLVSDVVITIPTAVRISYNTSSNPPACGGGTGSITINVSGGTSPYQYKLNAGSWSGNVTPVSGTVTITGLTSITYTIQVKDNNSCISADTVARTLSSPTSPTLSGVYTPPSCTGNNATVVLTAGAGTAPYTYSKDGTTYGGSNSFSETPFTTSKTYYVKDANTCITTVVVNGLGAPPTINTTYTVSGETSSGANDGKVRVTLVGGSSNIQVSLYNNDTGVNIYQIINYTPKMTTFTGLVPGIYNIGIYDIGNGCPAYNIAPPYIIVPDFVPARMYYFRFNLDPTTPTAYPPNNYITTASGSTFKRYDLTDTTNTYVKRSDGTSEAFANVVDYYKDNVSSFAGGSLDLFAAAPSGWGSGIVTFTLPAVTWPSNIGILVPAGGAGPYFDLRFYNNINDGGLPFHAAGRRAVTIDGYAYTLYTIYSISKPAGTTTTINITA